MKLESHISIKYIIFRCQLIVEDIAVNMTWSFISWVGKEERQRKALLYLLKKMTGDVVNCQ